MFRPIAAIFRLLQFCSKNIIYMPILRGDAENSFFLLNTIIIPYYHSCVFMTDIYFAISLSTHNGGDTPQNYERLILFIE